MMATSTWPGSCARRRIGRRGTPPAPPRTRAAGRLDEYVAAVITTRMARPDAADLLAPPAREPDLPDLRRQAAALREFLNEQARCPRRHRRAVARGRQCRAAPRT